MPNIINYVKFIRGTSAAFERLSNKDNDTLYFISDAGSNTGKLYLGSRLIAGSSDISELSINDLKDVIIDATGLLDGDVLTYDAVNETWINKPLEEVVVELMRGATATQDGQAGLVPAPVAGQEGYFLRGDGTWAMIPTPSDITELTTKVNTIIGDDDGMSMRQVAVAEVAKIVADAPESFDTLKEIAAWIAAHPEDTAAMNAQIQQNKADISELQTAVATNTTNIATNVGNITLLQTKVGTLEGNITALQEADITLQTEINQINQRLTWVELEEE